MGETTKRKIVRPGKKKEGGRERKGRARAWGVRERG